MSPGLPAEFCLPVQAVSILEQAYTKLRGAIMVGQLLPGQRLVEVDLASRMSISRPTLREVLRRLESDRLIEFLPNRGSFVSRLTPNDIDEIGEVWAMLTGQAVYRFAARSGSEETALIGERLDEVVASSRAGNVLDYIDHVNRLFGVVLRNCGNVTLADTIRRLVARINFLRAQSLTRESRQNQCTNELRQIVEAIRKRQASEARMAANRHIIASCFSAKEALDHPFTVRDRVA